MKTFIDTLLEWLIFLGIITDGYALVEYMLKPFSIGNLFMVTLMTLATLAMLHIWVRIKKRGL